MKRVAWVSSWDRVCGIADYSKVLLSALRDQGQGNYEFELISLDEFRDRQSLSRAISQISPDILHIQHEYAFYGGKNPPFYWFPSLIAETRKSHPKAKIMATGHTVLPSDYRFPVKGRGLQAPVRACANGVLLGLLRRYWGPRTWGQLDGVIVHSRRQVETIRSAGARLAREIPLSVPPSKSGELWKIREVRNSSDPATVLVFGFLTPEKGQDIAISALSKVSRPVRLVLAGGIRREKDQPYHDALVALLKAHNLSSRVKMTGFIPPEQLDSHYQSTDLVLAPFRETSGSQSLAEAFSRGAPILASDLPLNLEISERVPGALAYFRSEDPEDCARAITRLLGDPDERVRLSRVAREYAERFSPAKIAKLHLEFYDSVLGGKLREVTHTTALQSPRS